MSKVKDPGSTEPFFVVWCSPSNLNDGSATDTGILQGETISTSTWTVPTGITKNSDSKISVTIQGVIYAVNTVTTVWLTGGTAGTDYDLVNTIVTSGARTLDHTLKIKVRNV